MILGLMDHFNISGQFDMLTRPASSDMLYEPRPVPSARTQEYFKYSTFALRGSGLHVRFFPRLWVVSDQITVIL